MKNKKKWTFFLALFFWFFSLLQWFFLDQAIKNKNLKATFFWLVFFLFFLGLFLLLLFLIKNQYLIGAILVGAFVPVFTKLTSETAGIVIIVFGLFLCFSFLTWARIKKEKNNCIKVDVSRSIRAGMLFFAMAISFLAGGYSFAVWKKENKVNSINFLVPQVSSTAVVSSANLLGSFILDEKINLIAANVTIDQYLAEIFRHDYSQIENGFEEMALPGMTSSKELKEKMSLKENQFQEQIISLEKEKISQLIGKEVTGQERISEVLAKAINLKLKDAFETINISPDQFSWGFLAVAVLTTYSLIWFFLHPLLWTSEVLFYILLKTKIVKKEKVMKEAEELIVL